MEEALNAEHCDEPINDMQLEVCAVATGSVETKDSSASLVFVPILLRRRGGLCDMVGGLTFSELCDRN